MRERILFISGIVLLVGLVPLVYYLLFERGLSVASVRDEAPQAPAHFRVEPHQKKAPGIPVALALNLVQGPVEIQRGQGEWKRAEVGMVLEANDRIRTATGGQAALSMPGVFEVRLDSDSEFTVRSLAEDVFRFMLSEGMIDANVVDDPNTFFEVAASTAVARTRGGSFRMHVDAEGQVAVGTQRGSVDLEAEGKVVKVAAGYLARAVRGEQPQDPIRIPKQLMLKVRWPKKRELSTRKLVLSGKTAPGARLRIDGVTVAVDERGRFRKVVTLKEGSNRIAVESEDVGGNRTQLRSPSLQVDTRSDSFQIQTSPDMWKKKKGG
ncbi:MAG: FecR domain-containing protein [Deltaproteobacteria bacterium]|nr:FecR domain-containing protein [Deltaproteobacteria bacterium]